MPSWARVRAGPAAGCTTVCIAVGGGADMAPTLDGMPTASTMRSTLRSGTPSRYLVLAFTTCSVLREPSFPPRRTPLGNGPSTTMRLLPSTSYARRVQNGDSLTKGMDSVFTLVLFMGGGWLLDRWLGTAPWFMIGLVVL